jgi:hypothetical protein
MLAKIKAKIEPDIPRPTAGPYGSSVGDSNIDDSDIANSEAKVDDIANTFTAPPVHTSSTTEKSGTTISSESKVKEAVSAEDPSLDRMKKVLDSMLKNIQHKIDDTEKALTDKVQLIDKDADGFISSAELKEAMMKVLKRYPSDTEAESMIALLDKDKDGIGMCMLISHKYYPT